ncbi:hypothetical protein MY11210_005252 [Beauveria gryllotalpidicola]
MKLVALFFALADVFAVTKVAAGDLGYPLENRNHTCHGPKDCDIKCENGTYYRHRNPATDIETLRCKGANSDYTYWHGQCRREMGDEGVLFDRNAKACKLVGGLLCVPYKVKQIKKSTWHRCIFDPIHFKEWDKYCTEDNYNSVTAIMLKDVPYTCHPDYLP